MKLRFWFRLFGFCSKVNSWFGVWLTVKYFNVLKSITRISLVTGDMKNAISRSPKMFSVTTPSKPTEGLMMPVTVSMEFSVFASHAQIRGFVGS